LFGIVFDGGVVELDSFLRHYSFPFVFSLCFSFVSSLDFAVFTVLFLTDGHGFFTWVLFIKVEGFDVLMRDQEGSAPRILAAGLEKSVAAAAIDDGPVK